jgi:hypothetical protein
MESRPAGDAAAPAAAPEKASVVEDFIEIFHAPSRVFDRRRDGGFGLQLLIVTVLAAAFAFASQGVMSQIFDAEYNRATEKMLRDNPQLTADMLAQGRAIQEKITSVMMYIGTPLMIFVIAIFVWLFSKFVSAKLTYGQAAMITTLAFIPRLVGMLLGTLQGVVMDTSNVTSMFSLSASPARFMNPDTTNPKLFAAMGNLDVFAIWSYILIGIGIAVVGRVSRGSGFIVAAILFVLGSIPLMLR